MEVELTSHTYHSNIVAPPRPLEFQPPSAYLSNCDNRRFNRIEDLNLKRR